MSIKRGIAKIKIAKRRREERKYQKEQLKLTLARNKAIKEAERAMAKAKVQEEIRKEKARKARAEAPLLAEKRAKRKKRQQQTKQTLKGIQKIGKGLLKTYKKHTR